MQGPVTVHIKEAPANSCRRNFAQNAAGFAGEERLQRWKESLRIASVASIPPSMGAWSMDHSMGDCCSTCRLLNLPPDTSVHRDRSVDTVACFRAALRVPKAYGQS